ncbi:MAG: hypothetical protein H5T66_06040 [Chloroflexi bacterium]|nr:hypothetical protein [Chloroflexota bacterium]
MREEIIYFEEPGPHTEEVFTCVDRALTQEGIQKIVLASTRGDTARYALTHYRGQPVRLVIIPHQYGFGPGQRFPQDLVTEAQAAGHAVHFGTMLFHTGALYGVETPRVVANFLRCFGQGFKVAIEILLMAGDAGLVAPGEKVIAVAGTGRGADTALVALGATSQNLKTLHITRILCKPL